LLQQSQGQQRQRGGEGSGDDAVAADARAAARADAAADAAVVEGLAAVTSLGGFDPANPVKKDDKKPPVVPMEAVVRYNMYANKIPA
jgi:hypothetical protein